MSPDSTWLIDITDIFTEDSEFPLNMVPCDNEVRPDLSRSSMSLPQQRLNNLGRANVKIILSHGGLASLRHCEAVRAVPQR